MDFRYSKGILIFILIFNIVNNIFAMNFGPMGAAIGTILEPIVLLLLIPFILVEAAAAVLVNYFIFKKLKSNEQKGISVSVTIILLFELTNYALHSMFWIGMFQSVENLFFAISGILIVLFKMFIIVMAGINIYRFLMKKFIRRRHGLAVTAVILSIKALEFIIGNRSLGYYDISLWFVIMLAVFMSAYFIIRLVSRSASKKERIGPSGPPTNIK